MRNMSAPQHERPSRRISERRWAGRDAVPARSVRKKSRGCPPPRCHPERSRRRSRRIHVRSRREACAYKKAAPGGAALGAREDILLHHVVLGEGVAALGAELGRIAGVFRLPAALVALVEGRVGGLLRRTPGRTCPCSRCRTWGRSSPWAPRASSRRTRRRTCRCCPSCRTWGRSSRRGPPPRGPPAAAGWAGCTCAGRLRRRRCWRCCPACSCP